MNIIIELEENERNLIQKSVSGSGGWQSLIKKLQGNISENKISLSDEDIAKIIKYQRQYGYGGFENRLRPLIDRLKPLTENVLEGISI